MDITAKWSSCVERVKSKRPQELKAKRIVEQTDGSKILQSYVQIFSNMKALHKFLSANKFKYISSNECHLWSPLGASNMDEERFKIDNETKELIQLYKEEIESESQHLKKVTQTNDQRSENSAMILEFLEKYSTMLQACMSDMQLKLNLNKLTHVDYTVKTKAARKQGSLLDGKQYEKMNENLDKKHFRKRSNYGSDAIDDDADETIASSSTNNTFGSRDSLRTKKSTSATNLNSSDGNAGNLSPRKEDRLGRSRELVGDDNNSASNGASGNMSETKREELMLENKQLVDKLETFTSQINEVQHQIMFLSQATSLMAEHVEQQAESIDSMLVQTEESRENFGRGNRNIQKAKATAGDFRLCTITLLIFLSFSLLFLHWIH